MKTILKILVPMIFILLIVGISMAYYISRPIEYPTEMCFKGRYLAQVEEGTPIYSRIKKLACEEHGKIIILEDIE